MSSTCRANEQNTWNASERSDTALHSKWIRIPNSIIECYSVVVCLCACSTSGRFSVAYCVCMCEPVRVWRTKNRTRNTWATYSIDQIFVLLLAGWFPITTSLLDALTNVSSNRPQNYPNLYPHCDRIERGSSLQSFVHKSTGNRCVCGLCVCQCQFCCRKTSLRSLREQTSSEILCDNPTKYFVIILFEFRFANEMEMTTTPDIFVWVLAGSTTENLMCVAVL